LRKQRKIQSNIARAEGKKNKKENPKSYYLGDMRRFTKNTKNKTTNFQIRREKTKRKKRKNSKKKEKRRRRSRDKHIQIYTLVMCDDSPQISHTTLAACQAAPVRCGQSKILWPGSLHTRQRNSSRSVPALGCG
jgi:hypothetical protein